MVYLGRWSIYITSQDAEDTVLSIRVMRKAGRYREMVDMFRWSMWEVYTVYIKFNGLPNIHPITAE